MRLAGFKGWACSCGKVHARSEQGGAPAEASARQEPPPRCLVLFAEGVVEAIERGRVRMLRKSAVTAHHASTALQAELAALHDAASGGCCGFVALRTQHPPLDDDAAAAHRVAQLLCLLDGATPLAQRTKDLRVVVVSGVAAVRSCVGAGAAELVAPLHDSAALSAQFVDLLGLNGGPGVADVVIAHLQPAGGAPWQPSACETAAAELDALLQALLACRDVAQRLYIVLLLGRNGALHSSCVPAALPKHLAHLRPEQSFMASQTGGIEEHALLCVHSLRGVVRCDEAGFIGHDEFVERGARGAVLADDVLAELAFKLGRASKYGA